MDVAIAADVSTSVKLSNLAKMRTFLQGLVYGFGVSAEGTHFAMILFAGTAPVYFGFTEAAYYEPAAVKQKVADIPDRLKYGRKIDRALSRADKDLFTVEAGDRPDKPNILLVLTNGNPRGDYKPFNETVSALEVSTTASWFHEHAQSLKVTILAGHWTVQLGRQTALP